VDVEELGEAGPDMSNRSGRTVFQPASSNLDLHDVEWYSG